MVRLARAPPIVALALAMGAGATLFHLGVPPIWTLLPLPALLFPNQTSRRPGAPLWPLLLALAAGNVVSYGWREAQTGDCRLHLAQGEPLSLPGRMAGPVADWRGEFHPAGGGSAGCRKALRVIFRSRDPGTEERTEAGRAVTLHGSWQRARRAENASPLWAGYLLVDSLGSGGSVPSDRGLHPGDLLVMLGGRVQSRLRTLFPTTAGLATALVWARKEGLDPDIREAFARAGTAHLLAISGFHVGVVAGLLLLLFGSVGMPHALRFLLASSGVWLYVIAIGCPDAALRAALLCSVLALGRFLNRSVSPLGALASAFVIFLLLDPGALVRPGFQLSFAGALGLVLGYRTISAAISDGGGGRLPLPLVMAVAAGIAATLATLPLVAWHFGRVSLIGIPVTLLMAPLVAFAIPGVFASLLGSLAHPGLGGLLARGVELILFLLTELVRGAAGLPFSSVWVSRPTVLAGTVGVVLALLFLRLRPRSKGAPRSLFLTWWVAVGVLVWPVVTHFLTSGVLEIVVLDVGQGDALLLRSPGHRWILVDAGPRNERFDAGARTVLPYLRKRGVGDLDLLVLTHPDMDHVGGAPAILRELAVGGVADPGEAVGKEAFLEVLQAARDRGVPWRVLGAGDSMNVDGVALRVLGPEVEEEGREDDDANSASIVFELRFGAFSALLTGDAPASSELRFLPRLLSHRFQLLKVGHHGSSTSTTQELVDRTEPEVALISVGRRNRYGHPDRDVLQRLRESGSRVLRTDLLGSIVVKARRDGTYQLSSPGG